MGEHRALEKHNVSLILLMALISEVKTQYADFLHSVLGIICLYSAYSLAAMPAGTLLLLLFI